MNYDEVVAAGIAYADRQDLEVANNIDVFIVMVESRINRLLKTREQSYRAATPTVTDLEFYSIPVDYAGMRDIQISGAPDPDTGLSASAPMVYLAPIEMNTQRNKPFGGSHYYTIIGNQIQVFPIMDAGKFIEMVYYQKVPNLNSVNSENWLSNDHPDVYIAGLTSEIELFAKNYESGMGWRERLTSAVDEIENTDVEERWSGAPLTIRILQ